MSTKADDETAHLWGRRTFVTAAGWASVAGALIAGGVGFVGLLYRRAPVDPPTTFRAGLPESYPPNSVSDRFLKKWRVFIVRTENELFAVYAKCTHLGCTPRWYSSDKKFKCPCHGSGFTPDGVNFEGPAPRPLPRAKIWVGPDGELRVDVGQRFESERWHLAGASIGLGGDAAAGDKKTES